MGNKRLDGRNFKAGNLIRFINEKPAYEIMASCRRFVIAVRKLNRRADSKLLWHQVEMSAYNSFTEAYQELKNEPVYTIIDIDKNIRGPHNLVFNLYDFYRSTDQKKLIEGLINSSIEISKRNSIELDIDYKRTKWLTQ